MSSETPTESKWPCGDVHEMVGGCDFVLQVGEQEADAERCGEGLEVLDGGEGVFDGGVVPLGVG